MLTMQDCLDFSGLTQEAIDAIAEHEHVPQMIAVGLASSLLESGKAHADNESVGSALNTESVRFLVKPFKVPELRCAIENALDKHPSAPRAPARA
jgi:hypothetical protein